MEHILSYDEVRYYIEASAYFKTEFFQMLNVLQKKEETVINEVFYITTFRSANDENRCKEDEIALRICFAGYEEESAYLKYPEFLKLVKNAFLSNTNRYREKDRKEIEVIIQMLEKNTLNDWIYNEKVDTKT